MSDIAIPVAITHGFLANAILGCLFLLINAS
jgi:hypothetical protein